MQRRYLTGLLAGIACLGWGTAFAPAETQSALESAQAKVRQQDTARNRVRTRLDREFKNSAHWISVSMGAIAARQRYESARRPIFEALWNNPQYLQLQHRKMAEEERLEALRTDPATRMPQIYASALKLLEIRQSITELESAAYGKSDEVERTQSDWLTAGRQLQQLRQEHRQVLRNNPELAAARQRVELARQQAIKADRTAHAKSQRTRQTITLGYLGRVN